MTAPQSQDQLDMLYGYVTVTALAAIFALDPKQVNKRLVGKVTPNAEGKVLRYRIRDAAPHLVDFKFDVEDAIKKLPPSKIPPALQDAFWKAQLSRQKFEENRGDLWRTSQVIKVMGTAFQIMRMQIMMFRDTLQHQTDLTDRQVKLVDKMSDDLLLSLRKALVDEFELYVPSTDEHGADPHPATEIEIELPDEEVIEDDGLGDDDDGLGD
jgi:hypothetical protein